jgi:hypothetical protein
VSTTVIVPLVGEPPASLGTIVYVPTEPTVKFPTCDFVIPSVAGEGRMVVGSFAEAELLAPPPDTVAEFVTLPAAVAPTVISTLGATACGAMALGEVQVTV